MGPIPANSSQDPNSYGGQPLSLGNLQHEQNHPKPGAVPAHLLTAHTRAQTATIVSVFPAFRYRTLPLVGQLLLLLPPAQRDTVRIRKMRPEVMANAVQPPEFANSLPWVDEPEAKVPRGKGYAVLVITDSFQWVRDITAIHEDNYIPAPIPAARIAEALVAEWGSGLAAGSGRAGIGVWDPNSGWDLPQYVEQLRAGQEAYFRQLVMAADINFARTGQKEITDLMRMAAEWLGTDRDWNKAIEEILMKRCPACTRRIPQAAMRCQECHTELPLWYQQYKFPAAEIFSLDPDVGRFMQDRGMLSPPVVVDAKPQSGKAAKPEDQDPKKGG